jgi:hypothetical protein
VIEFCQLATKVLGIAAGGEFQHYLSIKLQMLIFSVSPTVLRLPCFWQYTFGGIL